MSRKAAVVFDIRPEALKSWLTLGDALDQMADDGRSPVCADNPDQWGGDATKRARKDAAEACTYCPVIAACRAFAEANREKSGVWGGHNYTPTTRRKAVIAA